MNFLTTMRQVHWSEITPQPFLRAPSRDMLTDVGLLIRQSAGARNSRIPYELREQINVIYDKTYVYAWFNNAFSRLGLPLLSPEHFDQYFSMGLNPMLQVEKESGDDSYYKNAYQVICDEVCTFAAMLPSSGNGSRDPNAYTARWYHAVKFLEKIENILQLKVEPNPISKDELKARLARLN